MASRSKRSEKGWCEVKHLENERAKMPYNERIKHYAYEKRSVLEMCTTHEEIERALQLLRHKWRV